MTGKITITRVLGGLFALVCGLTVVSGQKGPSIELSLDDKRQIIESLLREKFGDAAEKTIYISTANLPEELVAAFPTLKNKRFELVAADADPASVCAFEFGRFETNDRFVSVAFGDCREGLAYDFKKFAGKWKSVGLVIPR